MKQGDEIDLFGPAGDFRLREPPRDSVFIACGAGISPLRSMIQSLLAEDEKGSGIAITLLYGARKQEGLFFANEFNEAALRHPSFRFLPTLSRGGEDWSGLRGYVQEHVDDALRAHSGAADIYLCGQPEMVRDVRALLEQAGVDQSAVHYEKFE
jgi:ferredoxin-NADP reductase